MSGFPAKKLNYHEVYFIVRAFIPSADGRKPSHVTVSKFIRWHKVVNQQMTTLAKDVEKNQTTGEVKVYRCL